VTLGRSTPQDLLGCLRVRLPEYLVPATMTVLDVEWDVPRITHAGPEPNWRDPRQVFLTGRDELTE
jgi:hypothetical protein